MSPHFIADLGTDVWFVAYTERVVRVCDALLFSAYEKFFLWYVPPDVIKFTRQFIMAMKVSLGSHSNVRKLLELLNVIEATHFSTLPDTWRKRTYRAIDCHPGPVKEGADFVFYEAWNVGNSTSLRIQIALVPQVWPMKIFRSAGVM